jgi:hypothetical protein
VEEDKDLLPTDDEGEPTIALKAVTPGTSTRLESDAAAEAALRESSNATALFYLALAIVAFILVNLLGLGFAVLYVKKNDHKKYQHAEFHESIMAIHENVHDLHQNVQDLHLITFHGDEEAEDAALVAAKNNQGASWDAVASLATGEASAVLVTSLPGSPPEEPADKARKTLQDATKKMSALNKIRKDKGLPTRTGEKHVYRQPVSAKATDKDKDWV